MKETLANQYHELEDAPPLDARIGALGSVPVYALAHDDVALLVLDLRDEFRHGSHYLLSAWSSQADLRCVLTLLLQRILWRLGFGNVDNAVHVE